MIVTFENYLPQPRFDGEAWTGLRIEESASVDGPWADVETIALSPVDSDPTDPQSRSFTTELATLADGYYRVVFLDETGDESLPTEAVRYGPTQASSADIKPTVADVSNLIPGRVSEGNGGVFGADTTPTGTQVASIIDLRAGEVYARCESIPVKQVSLAKVVVTLAAAIDIERGYFPQEQDNDSTILDNLGADFNAKMMRLEFLCRPAWVSRVP